MRGGGRRWSVLALLAALVPASAMAQLTMEDDFEGTLLKTDTPAGLWDQSIAHPDCSTSIDPGAAHTGDGGLRFVDGRADGGPPPGQILARAFSGSGDQSVRFWWRTTPSDINQFMTLVNININSTINSAVEAKWYPDGGALYLVCHDRQSNPTTASATRPMIPDGGFHLIEVMALGVGSTTGSCVMSVDGQLLANVPIDWNARQFSNLSLSSDLNDDAWTGTMDFDTLVATNGIGPTSLTVDDAGVLSAGGCEPLLFHFEDSFGATRGVEVQEGVELSVDGGELFGDQSCTFQLDVMPVGLGVGAFYLYARPTGAGPLFVSLRPRTMMGAVAVYAVDGGAGGTGGGTGGGASTGGAGGGSAGGGAGGEPQPGNYSVACGCSAAGAAPLWFALAWVLTRRRR